MPSPRSARRRASAVLGALCTTLCFVAPAFAEDASDTAGDTRRHIQLRQSELPFSDGVLVGDTLYLSGRLGLEPETRKVPESPRREAQLILDGMRSVLAEADMTMDDLVSVQVFCSNVSLYPEFNEVYRTYFGKEFPARAFVGSGDLLFGARFEVQGIAVRR